MDKSFKEIFKNPGNEYRAKPFWSWNGKLEKDEISLRKWDSADILCIRESDL